MNFIKRINNQGWISLGIVILIALRHFSPSLRDFMGTSIGQTEMIIVIVCAFCFGYWGIEKEK